MEPSQLRTNVGSGDREKLWKALLAKVLKQHKSEPALTVDELQRIEKLLNEVKPKTMKSKPKSNFKTTGLQNSLLHSLYLLRDVQANENRRLQQLHQLQQLPAAMSKAEAGDNGQF